MKIAVAYQNSRKFINDIVEHWEKNHEVRVEPGASEKLVQWADIYYIDDWDNNIHYLYDLYHGDPRQARSWMTDWDNNKKPLIVVRPLDWSVWIGLMRDQQIIDWVDKIIFIAKHIQDKVNSEVTIPPEKQALIKPGVNLDKFTLKTKQTDGFQLGMCLGDMWKYKNHMGGLDIFTTLYQQDKRWRLHVRGQHENSSYDPTNWDYYLESRGIKDVVTLYPHQEDMNEWYENIDILLHPGQKEAFCYAIGEAMAKGIPAVINDFYGSHDIWEEEYLYKTHNEAIEMVKELNKGYADGLFLKTPLNREIQGFIKNNYNIKTMVKEIDSFIGL